MIISELIKGQQYWLSLDHMTPSDIGVTGPTITKPSIQNDGTTEKWRNDTPKKDAGKQTPMQSMKVNYLKGSLNETLVHVGTPDGLVKINQFS